MPPPVPQGLPRKSAEEQDPLTDHNAMPNIVTPPCLRNK